MITKICMNCGKPMFEYRNNHGLLSWKCGWCGIAHVRLGELLEECFENHSQHDEHAEKEKS